MTGDARLGRRGIHETKAAVLFNVPLLIASAGLVMGMFGLVTVNDAMVGKYTADEWRAPAYAVRYFIGFTAAGIAVSAIAWLHARGGFELTMKTFSALCIGITVAALLFPAAKRRNAIAAQPAQ